MKKPHTTSRELCLNAKAVTAQKSGVKKSIFFPLFTLFTRPYPPEILQSYQPFHCIRPAITGVPEEAFTENMVPSEKNNDLSAGRSILRSFIFFDWKDHG